MARPFRGSAEERARLKAAVDDACARHDRERLGEMGRGASGFREFVRGLPDDIARQREAGLPVTFPAAALPADPERRASTVALMGALGVDIVEEQPVSAVAERATRADRLRDIVALRAEGLTHEQIGARTGLSRSYIAALLADPTGEKERARKDSYRKPCPNCGRLMDGSNGNGAAAPRLCRECAKPEKYWTAEKVIEAIQRFAREHGRPPVVTDWLHADPLNDYPSATAVYGRGGEHNPTAAFASWADAIEAAGFDRPYSGTRRHGRNHRMADAHEVTETRDCTAYGCMKDAKWSRGVYAGLCEDHAQQKRERDNGANRNGAGERSRASVSRDGLAAKVKELGELGKEVDRKREHARKLTEKALAAKAEAEAAERAFQLRARELMGADAAA